MLVAIGHDDTNDDKNHGGNQAAEEKSAVIFLGIVCGRRLKLALCVESEGIC